MKKTTYTILFILLNSGCMYAKVTFYPATPENTFLNNGKKHKTNDNQSDWKWMPDIGNSGVFESKNSIEHDAPVMHIKVSNLEPKKHYEVFGYFWSDTKVGNKQLIHPAKFGVSIARFAVFSGKTSSGKPWIISPVSKHSLPAGISANIASPENTTNKSHKLKFTENNKNLIQARLGVARSNENGIILVFADDFPGGSHFSKTQIDGVGIKPVNLNGKLINHSYEAINLHLAIRSADWISFARELKLGADVNALDHHGLTPLFYASLSGKKEIAKQLLSLKADPNFKGQSILPLTAAATVGDVDMVDLLLDNGADVPTQKMEISPQLVKDIDPSLLHPAIAAIDTGSLKVLQRILKEEPDLNLENLGPQVDPIDRAVSKENCLSKFLVEHAVSMGNDSLAAFLIDRGCSLYTKSLGPDRYGYVFEPHDYLLARAIADGEALLNTREALFRRGVKLVYPSWRSNMKQLKNKQPYSIVPWDALSAAIKIGDLNLVLNLIDEAPSLPEMDKVMLAALAQDSENTRILETVRSQIPQAFNYSKPLPLNVDNKNHKGDLRLLIPRNKLGPVGNNGKNVRIAFVSSDNAKSVTMLLESRAAKINSIVVVDRNEMQKSIFENKLNKPWENGEHDFATIGDHISADGIVIITRLKNPEIDLIKLEIIDVLTGLPTMTLNFEINELNNDKVVFNLLKRIKSSIEKSNKNKNKIAFTILPLSVSKKIKNNIVHEKNLRLSIQSEINNTSGAVSVSTSQIRTIANEQNLKGQQAFWSSTYTIESGIQQTDENRVLLTLRINPIKELNNKSYDYKVEGSIEKIPSLVSAAWRKFIDSGNFKLNAEASKFDSKFSKKEGDRLLREAKWLLHAQDTQEALKLTERAIYLGSDPEKYVNIHLHCLASNIDFLPKRKNGGSNSTVKTRLPLVEQGASLSDVAWQISQHSLSLEFQSRLIKTWKDSRELLYHGKYYLHRYGSECYGWEHRDESFWDSILLLSFVRSSVPILTLSNQDKELFNEFCEDLDDYTNQYFKTRIRFGSRYPLAPNYGPNITKKIITSDMLKNNPQLLFGLVDVVFSDRTLNYSSWPSPHINDFPVPGKTMINNETWYNLSGIFHKALIRKLNQYKGPFKNIRLLEIKSNAEKGDARIAYKKKFAEKLYSLNRANLIAYKNWFEMDYFTLHKIIPQHKYYAFNNRYSMIPIFAHQTSYIPDIYINNNYRRISYESLRNENNGGRINAYKQIEKLSKSYYSRILRKYQNNFPEHENKYKNILSSIILKNLIYGSNLHSDFSREYKKLSKNKLPDTVIATLHLDITDKLNTNYGIIQAPLLDSEDSNILWVQLSPHLNDRIVLKGYASSGVIQKEQPILISIDCKNGKVINAENVIKLIYSDKFSSLPKLHGYSTSSFYTPKQNKTHIFIESTWWSDYNSYPKNSFSKSALISKSDLSVIALDKRINIDTAPDATGHRGISSNIAMVNNEFYLLLVTKDSLNNTGFKDHKYFEIFKVSESGELIQITVHGRKPNLTPFDSIDQSPKTILCDKNRLFVMHDYTHFAWYDPDNNKWDKNVNANIKKHVANLLKKGYRDKLFLQNYIKTDGTTYVVHPNKSNHNKLFVTYNKNGKKYKLYVPVDLKIPDSYLTRSKFRYPEKGKIKISDEDIDINSAMKTGEIRLSILNQTGNKILLGLEIKLHNERFPGGTRARYLPLLWNINKSDMLHYINSYIGDS